MPNFNVIGAGGPVQSTTSGKSEGVTCISEMQFLSRVLSGWTTSNGHEPDDSSNPLNQSASSSQLAPSKSMAPTPTKLVQTQKLLNKGTHKLILKHTSLSLVRTGGEKKPIHSIIQRNRILACRFIELEKWLDRGSNDKVGDSGQ